MIKIKRAYEKVVKTDGFRILIEQSWPKGLNKEAASIDFWMRPISAKPGLRKWFAHDSKKFPEFTKRYKEELKDRQHLLDQIKNFEEEHGTVTLLFESRNLQHNHAVVLREVLEK